MSRTTHALRSAAVALAVAATGIIFSATPLPAQAGARGMPASPKPTILLVHGAFADGSGWQRIIPMLQRDGYTVIAAQNPLTSLAEDVASTQRLIQAQTGPVVLVGHSYGGAIITGAAAGQSNVTALVYLAAFAPDAGEPVGAFNATYPSDLGGALVLDAAGFATIDRARFRDVFAADVSASDARVMAATHKPVQASTGAASVPVAAWRTLPTWYMVARQDRAVNPDLERFYAKRMGATTMEIETSHVPFISRPAVVVKFITDAIRDVSASQRGSR